MKLFFQSLSIGRGVLPPPADTVVTGSADEIMTQINDSTDTVINVGKAGQTLILDKPITVKTAGKTINLAGTIKMQNGVSRPLTQDSPAGSTVLYVDNADGAFKVGQQICSTDDAQFIHGDQTTRSYSNAFYVTAADATSVTVHSGSRYALTMLENATVGHYQSTFVIEANNTTIDGGGTAEIDGNGPNQHWEVYVGNNVVTGSEDTRFGCGIGMRDTGCDGLVVKGLTIRNAPLHSLVLWLATNFKLTNFKSYNVHDKHALFYECTTGLIDNFTLDGSLYEDGLSIYRGNSYIEIGNGTIKGCPRWPIMINNGCHNITGILGTTIDTQGGRCHIQGYNNTLETLILDRNNENSGLGSLRVFEVSENGSSADNNRIKHLVIKNSPVRPFLVKAGVLNFIIDKITLDNCAYGLQIWGGETTINDGLIQNISAEGITIANDGYLKVANTDFVNVAGVDPAATPSTATLILENCTGVTNGTY